MMENVLSHSCWCRSRDRKTEYTLYRRIFELAVPAEMQLAVSADCRYNLYLDGLFLGRGPRRGDLEHYFFENYSIKLEAGKHVLAAEVLEWTDRMNYPWSELHYSGAFLASGGCGGISLATPDHWRCFADHSRRTLPWCEALKTKVVYAAVPMEEMTADAALSRWREVTFDDGAWEEPEALKPPFLAGYQPHQSPASRWKSVPDNLPQMATEPITGISVLAADMETRIENGILSARIPAGKHLIRLDLGRYYTHLPTLCAHGGRGTCRIAYGEALHDAKGERDSRAPFEGGRVGEYGYGDRVNLTGGAFQFQPFWYRAGRFVELELTLTEPLVLDTLSFQFLHFPLKKKHAFYSPGDPVLEQIFETGWHTLLCCAHEHYEDCPYWEQMQYVGDTRIQALISYEVAGDGRLGRQAIRQFDWSRLGSGLTMSRYPSNFRQVIPEFSLFWIMMIADYAAYFGSDGIVSEHWNGIRDVLDFFEAKRLPSGLIGDVGEWNFSDWAEGWPAGCSNRGEPEPETLLNLIYAESCRLAAQLARETGFPAEEYDARRERVLKAVNACCRNVEGLYQDVPGREWFSQHTQIWALLSGAVPKGEAAALTEKLLHDKRLSACTLYFQFYLLEVLRRQHHWTGFREVLSHWEEPLKQGFTTFPECPPPATRSDCHAWSAGPCYQLLKYRLDR